MANRPFYYTNTEILVEGMKFILVNKGCLYVYGLILTFFLLSYFYIPNKGLSIILKPSDIYLYMGNLAILFFFMYKCLNFLGDYRFDSRKYEKLRTFKILIYLFLIPYIAMSYLLLILSFEIINVYFRYFIIIFIGYAIFVNLLVIAFIEGTFTDERIINIYLKKGTFPINPIKNAKVLSETKDEIEIILRDEEKERNLTVLKHMVKVIEDLKNVDKF